MPLRENLIHTPVRGAPPLVREHCVIPGFHPHPSPVSLRLDVRFSCSVAEA